MNLNSEEIMFGQNPAKTTLGDNRSGLS